MQEQLKSNLTSSKLWVRMVYMLLIALFCHLASFVMGVVVVVQCVITLISGSTNHRLKQFSHELVAYIQQGLLFLTFNSEFKPFPFSDWPVIEADRAAPDDQMPEGDEGSEGSEGQADEIVDSVVIDGHVEEVETLVEVVEAPIEVVETPNDESEILAEDGSQGGDVASAVVVEDEGTLK